MYSCIKGRVVIMEYVLIYVYVLLMVCVLVYMYVCACSNADVCTGIERAMH